MSLVQNQILAGLSPNVEQVVQGLVQWVFEYLQGLRFYLLSGLPDPVLDPSHHAGFCLKSS